jgi:hypothetical protein
VLLLAKAQESNSFNAVAFSNVMKLAHENS